MTLVWCIVWAGVAAILVQLIYAVGVPDDDFEEGRRGRGDADSYLDDD